MRAYLDIVERVLKYGTEKLPERKLEGGRKLDNGTIGLPNQIFSHDMSEGFPLLTTKRMPFKTIAVELEGFIQGITSKKWYQDRKCKIWDEWANPQAVEEFYNENYLRPYLLEEEQNKKLGIINIDSNAPPQLESIKKYIQQSVDDLGPIYGYQWRHFDEHYGEFKTWDVGEPNCLGDYQQDDNCNGVRKGTDQLANVVRTLKEYPNDRRMVCSAWNPNQIGMMALPPCHLGWVVTIYDNKLNLCWFQRSCDLALGVPFNIASYALLLQLLAVSGDFSMGNLTGVLIDCHIYNNQIEAMQEQLKRTPKPLPNVVIINPQAYPGSFDIFKWTHKHVALMDYNSDSKIEMEVTV